MTSTHGGLTSKFRPQSSQITETSKLTLTWKSFGATGGLFACECNEGLWNHFQTLRNYLRNLRNHCQQHRQTGRNRSKPLGTVPKNSPAAKTPKGLI